MLVNVDDRTVERLRQVIKDRLTPLQCASCDGHACWHEDDAKDAAEWADLILRDVMRTLVGLEPPGSAYERAQEDV